MSEIASSPLKFESLWRRIYRFLRALDAGLHADEASILAGRVTKIERELMGCKERK
jgi:hypothetical protein